MEELLQKLLDKIFQLEIESYNFYHYRTQGKIFIGEHFNELVELAREIDIKKRLINVQNKP